MIITRTPLRISFAGGGSDLPDFYKKHEGAVISVTIDKYVHITAHPNFHKDRILLRYSKTEDVQRAQELEHDIARTILSEVKMTGLEISSVGDVPAKTGLGSSSAFSVALHHVLAAHKDTKISSEELARKACATEIDQLKHPIGKQDQYASAYGGFNFYRFLKNGKVIVDPVKISERKKRELNENLILFYTGLTRSAGDILKEQKKNIQKSSATVATLKKMVDLTHEMRKVLEKNDIDTFGELLHRGWVLKQSVASRITNDTINSYYEKGLKNGALGGKLLGAGGGGCLLFYCKKENQPTLIKALKGLRHIPFTFSEKGSEVIFHNQ